MHTSIQTDVLLPSKSSVCNLCHTSPFIQFYQLQYDRLLIINTEKLIINDKTILYKTNINNKIFCEFV